MIMEGMDWYVINGEVNGKEVVRVRPDYSYEGLINDFERDYPGVTCINADLMRDTTAASYHVMPNLYERDIIRTLYEVHDG